MQYEPVSPSRRAVLAGLGLGVSTLALPPRHAYAFVPPVVAGLVGPDVLIALAGVFGVCVTGPAIATPDDIKADMGNRFADWVAGVGTSVAAPVQALIDESMKAGFIAIGSLSSAVTDAFGSFLDFIKDATAPKGGITLSGQELRFKTVDLDWGLFDLDSVGYGPLIGTYLPAAQVVRQKKGGQVVDATAFPALPVDVTLAGDVLKGRRPIAVAFEQPSTKQDTFWLSVAKPDALSLDGQLSDGCEFSFDFGGTVWPAGLRPSTFWLYSGQTIDTVSGIRYDGSQELQVDPSALLLLFSESTVAHMFYGFYDVKSSRLYTVIDREVTAPSSPDAIGWEVAPDIPADMVITGGNVVGHDVAIGDDGLISAPGSIAIPGTIPGTWNDALAGTGVGVITDGTTVGAGAGVSSGAIAGSAAGTVSGTLSDLMSDLTTSVSPDVGFGSAIIEGMGSVFPFSLPWDMKWFLDKLTAEEEPPDSVSIPIRYGSVLDTDLDIPLTYAKQARPLVRSASHVLSASGVIALAFRLFRRAEG